MSKNHQIGEALAERLKLHVIRTEGHDLAGPCIACSSSDAFRLHQRDGVGYCYSCGQSWSPFMVAKTVLEDCDAATEIAIKLGFPHQGEVQSCPNHPASLDPIADIASQKGVPGHSLVAFGAEAIDDNTISIPAYGPDGQQCTSFRLAKDRRKGLFERGKKAGLFFPHVDGKVRLPREGETWMLVEGVKDAAALHNLEYTSCGLNTCRLSPKFARLFRGIDIVLIPDRDRAGEDGADSSMRVLHGVAKSVRNVTLPAEFKESGGDDVRDILRNPDGEQLLQQAIEDAKVVDHQAKPEVTLGKKGHTKVLFEIMDSWDLWHTPDGVPYATVTIGDHQETWPVLSPNLRSLVREQVFRAEGVVASNEALNSAFEVIAARAQFYGSENEIHLRVAEHRGNIYFDLCNPRWQVVEITPEEWKIIDKPPVRFRRSRGELATPLPERGGSIDELRAFLNVDETAWTLIIGWLISALQPQGPYPLLALSGEQGDGKSTNARLIRKLIDPNKAPLRSEPRDNQDLMIAAENSWCQAFDNLSGISRWLSDALCRLSTGGGHATRELYTNRDESIFELRRPVMLTSIEEVATRSDLLNRCLVVQLPKIPEHKRCTEKDIEARFKLVYPRILGAIFDAESIALREMPNVKLSSMPRMADFAHWVTAAEKGLGWKPGTFLATYEGNRTEANNLALEASPIGITLVEFIQKMQSWSGTSAELLDELEDYAPLSATRTKQWPKNPRALSGAVKRIAPNLREAKFTVDRGQGSSRRNWILIAPRKESQPPVQKQCVQLQSCQNGGLEKTATIQSDSFRDDANDGRDAVSEITDPEELRRKIRKALDP